MPKTKRRSSGKSKKHPIRPCTYEMGYVRQDLYACVKCTAEANGQRSGFCRGCREICHADHLDKVFELYTKRDFRCDCGNSRARNKCKLMPAKEEINVGNEKCYGHNFNARYCRCDREYEVSLEMAQCAVCEDWFHEECYKTDAANRGAHIDPNGGSLNIDYELTCMNCVRTLPVLAEYYEVMNAWQGDNYISITPKAGSSLCTRPKNSNIAIKPGSIDYLWRPQWRLQLCRCRDCTSMYKHARSSFIVDRGDFVGAPVQDDLALLNATNDAEIINDVLEEKEAERRRLAREKAMWDQDRIPRKPLPGSVVVNGGSVSPEEVKSIRRRIQLFLEESIESNGGSLNPESVRAYLCDLKADLLSSCEEPLRL